MIRGHIRVALLVHPPADVFAAPGTQTGQYRNAVFSWLRMLNMGYRIPGVVNTDAHYNFHGSGWLRNYVKSSTDDPAQIDVMEMVHEAEHGHVIMTNGPFLEVSMRNAAGDSALPGDDLVAPDGKAKVAVRVQCPNWLEVNRVQVFLNGRPAEDLDFRRRSTPNRFNSGVVKFDQTLQLQLEQDTHVIVATIGEGLKLGPVVGPRHGEDAPVAMSNPVFVDVDGNGFQPNKDLLGKPLPYTRP